MITSNFFLQSDFDATRFINTDAWDSMRREVAQQKAIQEVDDLPASARNPSLAVYWSNDGYEPEYDPLSGGDTQRLQLEEFPSSPASVFEPETPSMASSMSVEDLHAVDSCFAALDQWLTLEVQRDGGLAEFDQELELLESVRQISLDLGSSLLSEHAQIRNQVSLLMEN